MKLSHMAMLLVAAVVVTVATSDDPLLRGNERFLGDNDFEKLKVKYQPDKDPKCWLKYKLGGKSEVKVEFDDDEVKVDGYKVTCVKKNQTPKSGLDLPLNEDLVLKDAEWVGEAVRDADVRWKKDDKKKKLEVAIKRFTDWGAFYDKDGDPKCKLEYNFKAGDTMTKIKFKDSQVSFDDGKVTCKINDVKDLLPEGLEWFKKDIPNDDVECVDCVVKDADVSWEKGDDLKLVIKTEPDDDDEELFAKYDWENGAKDVSGSPKRHDGELDKKVKAEDGKLTVVDGYGVDLGVMQELDQAKKVRFKFEDVKFTDLPDHSQYSVLLGGGEDKWWVGVDFDSDGSTSLVFNVGGWGGNTDGYDFDYRVRISDNQVESFEKIEYRFDGSKDTDERLAIHYKGKWIKGGWKAKDFPSGFFSTFPESDETVQINDGWRADWDDMNGSLGTVSLYAK